jgi:hypothetical protein
LPPLRSPCNTVQAERLKWSDLRDGRTNNLHRAVQTGRLGEVRELLGQGYAIEAMNLDKYVCSVKKWLLLCINLPF